jgi:hypothetical protein
MVSAGERYGKTAVRQVFPYWHLWRGIRSDGRPGDWYATRLRKLTPGQTAGGCSRTLAAASASELAELIRRDDERAARATSGDEQ